MPARSSDSKAVGEGMLEKLRVRRTSVRVPNQRKRNEGYNQMQRRRGMIVTMSVEQSGGVALKTAEGVAASHTRQVSTSSTLFSPLGVSIGVVCESTTENQEVVMDVKNCTKDNTQVELDQKKTAIKNKLLKKTPKSSTQEFRNRLTFLEDRQFDMLTALNIKSVKQLLKIPIRKLLDIKLSNEQLLSLVAVLEKEINAVPNSLELSTEDIQSLKSIAQELERMETNDDDDEQPLVIDESISNIEENIHPTNVNERSLDEIVECFSKIRNVKIPQSRAALKGVRSELTEIIAELNGKENTLLLQLQKDEQPPDTIINEISVGVGTEEIVTTTSKELSNNVHLSNDVKHVVLADTGKSEEPVKRVNGPRTAKRRRKINKSRVLKPSAKANNFLKNNKDSCDITLHTNSTHSLTRSFNASAEVTKSSSDTSSTMDVISQNTNSDIIASLTSLHPLPMLDMSASQMSPTFSGNQGFFFINPKSLVILHEDIVKGSGLKSGPIAKPFKKRLVDVSGTNSITIAPKQIFTPNVTALSDIPRILQNSDDTKTLSKDYVGCYVQKTSKSSKSFSAAPTQQKLQPTVMIKKLPTPLRKRKHNVDADSTTTSIDHRSSKGTKSQANATEMSSSAESSAADVAKNTKTGSMMKTKKRLVKAEDMTDDSNDNNQAKPSNLATEACCDNHKMLDYLSDVSDNSYESGELCSSEASDVAEIGEVQATVATLGIGSVEHEIDVSNHVSKSVSPESPLFESIKSESEEFEESGIEVDEKSSFLVTNCSEVSKNQSLTTTSSTPNAQRRTKFYLKSLEKTVDYSSYDANAIVTICNTPLSPISSGITSPIYLNNKLKDYSLTKEIDGCAAGVIYLLKEIDLPKVPTNKPEGIDFLLRTNTSDPRLIKYLKKNNIAVHASTPPRAFNKIIQCDPRRPSNIYNSESYLSQRVQEPPQQTPNMLLYGCLQRSPWYQSLMSTMKIQINQTISVLVRAINNFQKIRLEDPYAVFDIFKLYCAGELLEIMENLGLFVDVNGIVSEKKNTSSFAGRSYGCSSVVNATYSFIQPVEPSSVTVQHQQMRSFTAPRQNFPPAPSHFPPAQSNFSAATSNFSGASSHVSASSTFQPPAPPFISCYVDPPQLTMEKQLQLTQSSSPRPPPMQSLPSLPPQPRRHCGLKVPYSSGVPPSRASVSPIKQQPRVCSDSDEECWDLDEDKKPSTTLKLPLSPNSDNDCEQPQSNYSRPERFAGERSSNSERSFGVHKKRYQ